MKNILILAHADAGQEARLQAALDLTRALEGHLTCLDVIQLPLLARLTTLREHGIPDITLRGT